MNRIEEFYNKFNEDKRLKTRHGRVEYEVTMHYICKYIEELKPNTIVDIGAGAGAYTVPLLKKADNIIAIDVVRYNLGRLKQNAAEVMYDYEDTLTCYKRDARKLRDIDDNISDITLLSLGFVFALFISSRIRTLSLGP